MQIFAEQQFTNQSYLHRPHTFRQIGTRQGLPQSTVPSVVQDTQGFWWCATADGIARWDGFTMKVFQHNPDDAYSLSHRQASSLCCDSTGKIWVGTLAGLNTFLPERGAFQHVSLGGDIAPLMLEYSLRCTPDGTLWAVSKAGIFYKHPRQAQFSSLTQEPFARLLRGRTCIMLGNTDNEVWFGTERPRGANIGERRQCDTIFAVNLQTQRCEIIQTSRRYKHSILFPAYRDNNRVWWWYNLDGNVFRSDEASRTFVPETRCTFAEVLSVMDDEQGNHWVSSENNFCVFSRDYSFCEVLHHVPNDPTSIAKGFVTTWMGTLPHGIVWLSTDGGGLSIHQPEMGFAFTVQPPQTFVRTSSVRGIAEDKQGNIWFAALGAGVVRYSPVSGAMRQYPQTFLSKPVFAGSDGAIWTADDRGGLWHISNPGTARESLRRYVIGSMENYCITIAEEPATGALWLGGMTALMRFDKKLCRVTHRFVGFSAPELFFDSHGFVWAGSSEGVLVFHPKDADSLAFFGAHATRNLFRQYSYSPQNASSLSDNTVKCFYEDAQARMWIGTANGLNMVEPKTGIIRRFTEANGLPNNYVYSIEPDREGNIWVSTNKGLCRLTPPTSAAHQSAIRVFTVQDGLPANEFNRSAHCFLRSGNIAFGGIEGLVIIQPDRLPNPPPPPPTLLLEMFVNEKPQDYTILSNSSQTLNLRYDENTLAFNFVAPECSSVRPFQYAYKLEGLEEAYVQNGTLRQARYANVPPGDYVFRAKAYNSNNVWSSAGTDIHIRIAPPFWRTWWFFVGLVLLMVGSTISTTQFVLRRRLETRLAKERFEQQIERERLEKALELERERRRISQDIHDEVGAGLTKILMLSQNTADDDDDDAPERSKEISSTAQNLIDGMQEIIWSINPKNDTLQSLIAFIRSYAREFTHAAGMIVIINAPEELAATPLRTDVRRNVFLVVKEALNNAVKHSAATEIRIALDVQPRAYIFTIADNGKGFVQDNGAERLPTVRGGNGLENMRLRVEEIGGSFCLNSAPDEGTKIVLTVPR
jgi:signal transduction histidine kinase/ligand-binding sensor domain-containing protein